jgi:drug/metabolite transporter (DMT)-like permease
MPAPRESISLMKVLAFVIVATIFEAVGDAVMRIALKLPNALPGRIALFALASLLLSLYGLFLNLAPVEFATVTGVYLAALFIAFQIVNYLFFRHTPSPGVLVGGMFIIAGAAIIYFWK